MVSITQPTVRIVLCALIALCLTNARATNDQTLVAGPVNDAREVLHNVAFTPEAARDAASLRAADDAEDTALAAGDEVAEEEVEVVVEEESADVDSDVLYRICRVTAYCDRGVTASGVYSGVGQCAAPAYIPFGARIYIPKLNRTFIVTDRTNKRFRNSTIDLFIPAKNDCRTFGLNFLDCEIYVDAPAQRMANLRQFGPRHR